MTCPECGVANCSIHQTMTWLEDPCPEVSASSPYCQQCSGTGNEIDYSLPMGTGNYVVIECHCCRGSGKKPCGCGASRLVAMIYIIVSLRGFLADPYPTWTLDIDKASRHLEHEAKTLINHLQKIGVVSYYTKEPE